MKPSKKQPLKKAVAFVIALTTLVVLVSFALLLKKEPSVGLFSASEAFDLIAQNKAQIISIVSKDAPLSTEERDKLFSSLSGQNMLRYHFTEAEKILIVKAINTQSDSKRSHLINQKNDFSAVLRQVVVYNQTII